MRWYQMDKKLHVASASCMKLDNFPGNQEEMKEMELEVKESISLEDGKHEGVISKIEYRTEPYEYTDVFIKEAKTGFELKYGCPTNVAEKTKLGKILSLYVVLKKGMKVDPEKVLLGKKVSFMTLQEKTKDGIFNRIVEGSIKSLE